MPVRKQVTLHTIAHELGLTIHTVSKALRRKQGMSEATRQLIVQTAGRLGYYTKDQILSLRMEHIAPFPSERKRFLLVQTGESVGYNRLLLQGLHDRFAAYGHQIDTLLLPKSVPDNGASPTRRCLLSISGSKATFSLEPRRPPRTIR